MAEVTHVPIQPIRKGSLVKLWLGIAAVLLVAAGLAWWTMPHGVEVETISEGTGKSPGPTDVVFVHYVGKLSDGTVFDRGDDINVPVEGFLPKGTPLPLEQMVPGFREAAVQMQKGGKYHVEIPADKAYGATGSPPDQSGHQVIPPNANLSFDIDLIDFMSNEDFQRRVQAIQQILDAQQSGQGAAPAQGAR
jgi:FKBP-type peptidyl-prolyl cis-trans isomerase FkpA